MSIGWKADYGYLVRDPGESFLISDIIVTDGGRPFTFATTYNNPILAGVYYFGLNLLAIDSKLTQIDAQNEVNHILGEDFFTLYSAPYWANIEPYPLNLVLSSMRLACPNLWSLFIGKDDRPSEANCCVIYIKSLKRALVASNTITGLVTPQIYVQNGNRLVHNPTTAGYFPPGTVNISGQAAGFLTFLNYDGTVESLTNINNVRGVAVTKYGNKWGVWVTIPRDGDYETEIVREWLQIFFSNYSDPDIDFPDDPYGPGGSSDPSQPYDPDAPGYLPPGTFDDTSDAIPDSSLPTLSAANTGFTRIYNPSLAQVQDLARYLWTDDTVIETIWNKIRQFFENPMDAIIGFNLVPVAVPNGGTKNFALMYIDTGVQMTAAASQFVDQDCGTVTLERYYGSALDQSPYTKVSCFLPYIGTVQLNTDEVMGTTLQVKYRVDIVSGSCVAKILVDGNVLYQYSGHCAIPIPFASADFASYVSAAISVAKLAIGAAAAGAAGAAGAIASSGSDVAQQTNQTTTLTRTVTNTTRNPSTGRQIVSGTTTTVERYEEPVSETSTKASFSGLSPANIANTVGQIMGSKPNVEHSGSFSGNTGYLGVRRPFLIIERPNMCLPSNYQTLNGYPAMITMKLGDCKGYTRIQQVQLTGLPATNPEQAEILSLLKSGVIF